VWLLIFDNVQNIDDNFTRYNPHIPRSPDPLDRIRNDVVRI